MTRQEETTQLPSWQPPYGGDVFGRAVRNYLSDDGTLSSVVEEWKQFERGSGLGRAAKSMADLVRCLRVRSGTLSNTDLRILDICVALSGYYGTSIVRTSFASMYLEELVAAGRADLFEQFRARVAAQQPDERSVVEGLIDQLAATVNRVGHPTMLGTLVLRAYLPGRLDDVLSNLAQRSLWLRGNPYLALVRLLLAARPPLVDAALHAAQQVPAREVGPCVVSLLEVASEHEQVREWARMLAGPDSPAWPEERRQVLAQLLRIDVHAHLDLAFEALRSTTYDELACVGLEAIFQADPLGSLPVVEGFALKGSLRRALRAVALLAVADTQTAQPLLQQCVETAEHTEVQVAAVVALAALDSWAGRDVYLCSLLSHHALAIRIAAADELAWLGEHVSPLIVSYLGDPRAKVRLAGAWALLDGGSAQGQEQVTVQLATERSPMVRRELQAALALPPFAPVSASSAATDAAPPTTPASDTAPHAIPEAVAGIVHKTREAFKHTRWRGAGVYLVPKGAAEARWQTGEPIPAGTVRYLLYCQSRVKGEQGALDTRAQQILARIDRASAVGLAWSIFNTWRAQGEPAANSWCLPLVCALGDSALAQTVFDLAEEFEWSYYDDGVRRLRIQVALRALRALAFVKDVEAVVLSQVGDIAHCIEGLHSHQRSVVEAAWQTLQDMATHQHMHYEELLDRAASRPNWGISGSRVFNYDIHSYTVQFASSLRWKVHDETGTRLRTMPKPDVFTDSTRRAYSDWKALQRQTRKAVQAQVARLETALADEERTWRVPAWQDIFLHHPLMRLIATNLVWALGDPSSTGRPTTFRPTDDGTLVAADGQTVALSKEQNGENDEEAIWLVRPQQLDDELREAWIAHLARTHRHPPVRQLVRL